MRFALYVFNSKRERMTMKRLTIFWAPALMGAMLLALAACFDSHATPGAPDPGAARADSYVMVTQLRPASPGQYVANQRSVYELCAVILGLGDHPRVAKPFPAVSDDAFGTRTTYASDGKRSVVRKRVDTLDFVGASEDSDCEMRRATLTSVTVSVTGDALSPLAQEDAGAPYVIAQVLEPVSLSVGKPVDPALFLLDRLQ